MHSHNFMEGSLTSYEIGDPRVPKILGNWGPRSLTSYENGDPGSPFSLDTGAYWILCMHNFPMPVLHTYEMMTGSREG